MQLTMAEKIVARAAGRDSVVPGEYVTVSPSYTVCQEISWQPRKRIMEQAGSKTMKRPDKVVMVVDHTTSASMGTPYYQTHREMQDFARETGAKFFGPGSGLRHLVMTERGYAKPGDLIFSDEPNIATVGVVGALNIAMSSEVVVSQLTDENWVMVPRSVRFNLRGSFSRGVMARDLVQVIIRDYAQTDTLSQSCIEYAGPAIAGMSLDERQSILACSYHAGADSALMPVDDLALAYARERAPDADVQAIFSDPGAHYDFETEYDLSQIEPMISPPPELHNAAPVSTFAGLHIDQAALGSCANSRLDDMRAVAEILKGRTIAPHVTFYITPGSREVYAKAASEGLFEIFMQAGATVLAPGCTTCWGYEGFLNPGETQLSTHQMNYHGRNGSRDSRSYLTSPYVVAAAAVAGKVVDPREVLR
jgi:3-isopropylmalate/(R)-2-methylmalate dehydratase large subunit